MAETIDLARVEERRQTLEAARLRLRAELVGIDHVIDQLCEAIAVWYTMPEVLARPVVVNLWGMTGVGKTDLVRRLVTYLGIPEHFQEIQLSNTDVTRRNTTIAEYLAGTGALEGEPTVLLFDEIQRFNTVDEYGDAVPVTKFTDFWELLSDGRLSRPSHLDLDEVITSLRYDLDAANANATGSDETNAGRTPRLGMWEVRQLKEMLGLRNRLSDLKSLTYAEAIDMYEQAIGSKSIYEPIDCSKCLIILCGNLDEAFTMATMTAETDVEADIFHAFTSTITMLDIKRALLRRFRPEQVARFGNVHLIYRSLRRADFELLIEREIARITGRARELFGIEVTVDPSVAALIYRNGVFPVQGVRPVFSTVADILETNLAKLLFDALRAGGDRQISLRHDDDSGQLVAQRGEVTTTLPFTGRVDSIRKSTESDKVANVAVHEAGHAVAYGLLFGLAPLQLTARVASSYVSGFTFPHQIYSTTASIVAQVKVLLAGGLAEELVFGPEFASIGRGADREQATRMVVDFVRRFGFDREFQANYMLDDPYTVGRASTDSDIEKMMSRLVAETRQLLSEHRRALVALASRLAEAGRLSAPEVAKYLGERGIEVAVEPEGHTWLPPFEAALTSAEPRP